MLKVLNSGFFTTIQDKGRFGYGTYGVPVSGVMDSYTSEFANALLGNSRDAAVLEITLVGPTLEFLKNTQIVIAGMHFQPQLNNSSIALNSIITIKQGDILSFKNTKESVRCYLAIKGGFLSKTVFGSRSMYPNITENEKLTTNDRIPYNSFNPSSHVNASVRFNKSLLQNTTIEVLKGPEFSLLNSEQRELIFSKDFSITANNNRMAYQLSPLLENAFESILTSPVMPGTVQLTPSGNLIVLMRDCQTTGGYPRVLQLTENAINCISHKTTGNTIKIRLKA